MTHDEQNQDEPPRSGAGAAAGTGTDVGAAGDAPAALFERRDRDVLWQRWTEIQRDFVDEPKRAVEQANELVSDLMEQLVGSFRSEQARLEGQWDQGEEASTEDLRLILQRYRSFFERLLEV